MAYPTGVKVFIDGKDATFYLFGARTIDPSDLQHTWRDVNISNYLRKSPGIHTIQITAAAGAGRVDSRIEIR